MDGMQQSGAKGVAPLFLHRMLAKLGLSEYQTTNWTLVSWERSLEQLDYDADIVFIGDNLTSGEDFQARFPDKQILNLGLSGDSHSQASVSARRSLATSHRRWHSSKAASTALGAQASRSWPSSTKPCSRRSWPITPTLRFSSKAFCPSPTARKAALLRLCLFYDICLFYDRRQRSGLFKHSFDGHI